MLFEHPFVRKFEKVLQGHRVTKFNLGKLTEIGIPGHHHEVFDKRGVTLVCESLSESF